MPQFKTTENILLGKQDYCDENWFDTPFLNVPDHDRWDYSRQLQIEDVDLWEVIAETGGGNGVYASFLPYAEFYMVMRHGQIESTYYGKGCDVPLSEYLDSIGMIYPKK